jgi:GT2 family glycosyltransferase
MFVRKAVFDEMGGFDEGFFLYFEDADLCKRLNDAGYMNYYDPSFEIVHQRGLSMESSGVDISSIYRKSQVRYYRKHKSRFSQFVLKNYLRITGKI